MLPEAREAPSSPLRLRSECQLPTANCLCHCHCQWQLPRTEKREERRRNKGLSPPLQQLQSAGEEKEREREREIVTEKREDERERETGNSYTSIAIRVQYTFQESIGPSCLASFELENPLRNDSVSIDLFAKIQVSLSVLLVDVGGDCSLQQPPEEGNSFWSSQTGGKETRNAQTLRGEGRERERERERTRGAPTGSSSRWPRHRTTTPTSSNTSSSGTWEWASRACCTSLPRKSVSNSSLIGQKHFFFSS